jgi:hypothetical protein
MPQSERRGYLQRSRVCNLGLVTHRSVTNERGDAWRMTRCNNQKKQSFTFRGKKVVFNNVAIMKCPGVQTKGRLDGFSGKVFRLVGMSGEQRSIIMGNIQPLSFVLAQQPQKALSKRQTIANG